MIRILALPAALVASSAWLGACSAPPAAEGPAQPVGQAAGTWKKLVFDDEFRARALETTKWSLCFPWGTCTDRGNPNEVEWYTAGNVSQGAGVLNLTARRQVVSTPYGPFRYTSGMVQTDHHFSFTYGYAEARIWVPAGKGLWPAFWLLPTSQDWPPEIDVMESDGALPDRITMTYHYGDARTTQTKVRGPNFTSGWHTFGIDWEPRSITWYVDGAALKRYSGPAVTSNPMYLILDLAVSGPSDWRSAISQATPLPATMRVGYVRVWQH